MANQLNSGFGKGQTATAILNTKGRSLTSGMMDEFDIEAESAANAISRANGLRPRKLGKRNAGFGKAVNHANASERNYSMMY